VRLYHFTSREHLPAIMARGLSRGDVPASMEGGFTAVWFTTETTAARGRHGIGNGLFDKTAVRIAVDFDARDLPALFRWADWAPQFVEPRWLAAVNRAGGGDAAAATWYFYRGTIEPARFADVCIRLADGEPLSIIKGLT
jgi:hypothetical protein